MKLLVLLLMAGATAILIFQNLTPIPLYFFSGKIALELPVTAWMLMFTAAGFLTSLFWQFLQYLQRQSNPKKVYVKEPAPNIPSPPKEQIRKSASVSESKPKTNPLEKEPSTSAKSAPPVDSSEWEMSNKEPDDDDWNIEESPSQPTPIRDFDRPNLEKERPRELEVRQDPSATSRSGSVYSYKYRESEAAKQTDKTDRVYDVNYRVLRSPDRQDPPPPTEEDDEWI